jgi:hypothetical protein
LDVVERKSLAISQAFPSEGDTQVSLPNACQGKDLVLDVANCLRGIDSQLELLTTIHARPRHKNDIHATKAIAIAIGFVLVLGIVRVLGRVLDLLWFLCLLGLLVILGLLVLLGLGQRQDGFFHGGNLIGSQSSTAANIFLVGFGADWIREHVNGVVVAINNESDE